MLAPAIVETPKTNTSGNKLKTALTPTVVNALMESVEDDPKPIADALYPVLEPAIRKSISVPISQMTNNFNQLLEQSVSPKASHWRFDACRTGRHYSEVVLLKT